MVDKKGRWESSMLSRTKTLDVAVNIGAVAARLTDTILVMSTTN
jgi:hypothetical protein